MEPPEREQGTGGPTAAAGDPVATGIFGDADATDQRDGPGRWELAWRTALGSLLLAMLASLLFTGALHGQESGPSRFLTAFPVAFGVLPAPVFGALAWCFAPWLRPLRRSVQCALFGALGAATLCAMLLGWLVMGDMLSACLPSERCAVSPSAAAILLLYAGVPVALIAGGGLGIAYESGGSAAGRRLFWSVLAIAGTAFVAVQALAMR
ncbi:hypothetical protein MUN78_07995 [Leucobacter allii]|uniref:Uncharacterized protein n=1 Tax=Leucobacter allii TaxID=2932247 RepID=A0ABY4FR41_9MICO|nr:hypothetical protein [Leucobacter allii]UOQ58750.1 hypothetical protein MUN78_07995 [Leucobacter allii]UOR03277.1 hypothetical protein MUN77_08345 [Leucobacter allii]